MDEKELFAKKAEEGYTVCYAGGCPMKEQCLRWLVGQQMPDTKSAVVCVNPRSKDVGTDACPHFRNREKVRFARGMLRIFNRDMPAKVEPFVRYSLIENHCKTYYYEYRKGERLIPPAMQQEVRSLFREAGWNEPVEFDDYVEDYEW